MARQREKRISVYKPGKHGIRWRVQIRDGVSGRITYSSYGSEQEAWSGYKKLCKAVWKYQAATIQQIVEKYRIYMRDKKNKEGSITTTIYRLEAFFGEDVDLPIDQMRKERVSKLYEKRTKAVQIDTHRNELREVRTFFRWCLKKGFVRENPAEQVEGIGKRKRGKMQLRPTEARLFLDQALHEAQQGNDGSLACAAALLLGLRSSEITKRVVRDLDIVSRHIYIEHAKTRSGDRKVEIPNVLWPLLQSRTEGKKPTDPLFVGQEGNFHHQSWVRANTQRICEKLALPRICAQSLRAMHSTFAQEGGATAHLVARQLGHANEQVTLDHYTLPGTQEKQIRKKTLRVLLGGAGS